MAIKVSKTKPHAGVPYTPSAAVDALDVPSLAWPLEHWLQFQAELLKATEPGLTGWLNRRREGTTALLRTFEKLAACRDIGEAMSVQSDWIDGALKRFDLDAQAAAEHALAMSQCAAGATRDVAQTTTEIATRGAEWITRKVESEVRPPDLQGVAVGASPIARSNTAELPTATQAAA